MNWNSWFLLYVIGNILYNINKSNPKPLSNRGFKVLLFVFGLGLLSYPVAMDPTNTIYKYLKLPFIPNHNALWHGLGCLLVFMAVENSLFLKNLLTNKILCWFVKISYSIFLTHFLVMNSWASFIFCKLINH